jgi:PKD repeat protein
VADFTGSPTSGDAPLTVDFTDLSTNATGWSWDFGDGVGTSTQQNPSYTYNNEGTYTVTLTASNACGSDIATKVDYISVTVPVETKAYAQSEVTALGTTTGSFANTYASDNVYQVITEALSTSHPRKTTSEAEHTWTFNLGSGGSNMTFYLEAYRPANSDGDDFVFEYSTDGATFLSLVTVASATEQVYSLGVPGLTGTVYVRVTDDNRAWDLTSLDAVFVDEMYFSYESGPVPPVADFVGTPIAGQPPLTVNFTDLSTGSPTTWAWDFGDGVGTSTAQNPSYTYNNVGTYTVSLTVTNAYGSDSEVKTGYISVTEAGNDMFVFDMAVGRTKSGAYYYGTCTVTIHDNLANPVSGATVYVTATGPTGGTYNGVTGGDGTVSFQTATGLKKPVGEWCFEVTNVTHATLTYDPASNNVTQECESGPVAKNGVGEMASMIPADFSMGNRPNPFNPATTITFALPHDTYVRLDVFNIIGQRVTTLADGFYSAGEYTVDWNGSNAASGIYLYRLTTDEFTTTRKMVLMK